MFDHELMDTETAAVKKELRSMKRTLRLVLYFPELSAFPPGLWQPKIQKPASLYKV